ncbi:class I SAM-dependent methyltransferase [Arthrobacter mobilis]|uniref:Methyltransferase domain-containing protein n=1 Tax=Arthrobacter mobilis TaxID=2724944 RepID=A0A7X6HHZ2_9MICC|nr:methyltransferase domain-containing protein [Arthrobacter mobilis]NKX56222.1 methyltransferase domain-containing protein [Arthrobacter mobilis]
MDVEAAVARHYGNPQLERIILDRLRAVGYDPDRLEAADLEALDHFHIGGADATRELARAAGIRPGAKVLDVGSGIGGPARMFAGEFGATVHGLDLTPSFVQVAVSLTRRTRQSHRVSFSIGSALRPGFGAAEFDVAMLLHVGMNIADKDSLFAQLHRVLKPGGRLVVYDIMRTGDGAIHYPMPWASHARTSFVGTAGEYLAALAAAGFAVRSERNRHGLAAAALERVLERMDEGGGHPLGPQLVIGPEAPRRLGNLMNAVRRGVLAPVEILADRED